jgi:hypothetical protein
MLLMVAIPSQSKSMLHTCLSGRPDASLSE